MIYVWHNLSDLLSDQFYYFVTNKHSMPATVKKGCENILQLQHAT